MPNMGRMTKAEFQRFRDKLIESVSGCWLWQGYLDRDGYGTFFFRRLPRRAHRVAYWAFVGDVLEGAVIDHTCLSTHCVNPDHLRVVSRRENILRGHGAGAWSLRRPRASEPEVR